MFRYEVTTANGTRSWWADDLPHAREQHYDAFGEADPYERIITVSPALEHWEGDHSDIDSLTRMEDEAAYQDDLWADGYYGND